QSSYRHKSPAIFSILIQLGHELFECEARNWLRLRRPIRSPHRRPDPALANAALDDGFRLAVCWNEFGDRVAAVGDDDRLAGRGQPDVFAELVLQDLEADGVHGR